MARSRTPTRPTTEPATRTSRAPLARTLAKREPVLPAGAKPWAVQAILQLTNQQPLRRQLGVARANDIMFDVADRLVEHLPGIVATVIGRWTIEIETCVSDAGELQTFVDSLHLATVEPYDLDGEWHAIDFAIGVAAGPPGAFNDIRLAEETEDAVWQSRNDGAPVIRDLSSCDPMIDKLAMKRELKGATDRGELFLQYQPKVHVRRQEIASAEALVRWRHPTRGLILPNDFIPLAEVSRDIDRITLWTIEQVIRDQKTLQADGQNLTIFVNISGQLLSNPTFVKRACDMVRDGGVPLGFEITETSVIRDPVSAIANLNIFADQGIAIAIDDYGAGLSSLAYLKQLPARELKIDKMFVLQLTSSNRDPLIVRSTIDLAHALEMEVTAEGVETPAALALLSVMGCDMIQGYLISRPIEIDAFRQFLRDHKDAAVIDTTKSAFRSNMFRRVG